VSSSILKSAIWRYLLARLIIEQVDLREMNPGFQFTYWTNVRDGVEIATSF
jgi:hypothetical protein